jgi:hypothetical protein
MYEMQPRTRSCAIQKEYETKLKIDGCHGMLVLAQCKLADYPSITEWSSAQKKLIDDLQTCGIAVDRPWRVHYILENLPKSTEWTNIKQMLTVTGNTESTTKLLSHLLTFEAYLKRVKGLPSDSALFVTLWQREKTTMSKITCFGCGVRKRIAIGKINGKPIKRPWRLTGGAKIQ